MGGAELGVGDRFFSVALQEDGRVFLYLDGCGYRSFPLLCRYLKARSRRDDDLLVWRCYMAEAARQPLGGGLTKSYMEMLAELREPPDTRTGDEVVADLIKSMGLEVTSG